MRRSMRRWLFHRRKSTAPPLAAGTFRAQRIRDQIAHDIESDPAMSEPDLGRQTAHITRAIDQGQTVPVVTFHSMETVAHDI